MSIAERPVWYLIKGVTPVKADRKRILPDVTHWCHEGDAGWKPFVGSGSTSSLEHSLDLAGKGLLDL